MDGRRSLAGIFSFLAVVVLCVAVPTLLPGIALALLFPRELEVLLLAGAGVVIGIGLQFASNLLLKTDRAPEGICRYCGYDLRGNPSGRRCPECGNPTRA